MAEKMNEADNIDYSSPQAGANRGSKQPAREPQETPPDADAAAAEPAPADEDCPEDEMEPAPTDYGRNAWLLIIILGVVVIAWGVSLLWDARHADDTPGNQPAPGQAAGTPGPTGTAPPPPQQRQPNQPRRRQQQEAPSGPSYQKVAFRRGGDTLYIDARPEQVLPSGQPYQRPRLFDVTNQAPGFAPDALWRRGTLEQRHTDQMALRDLGALDAEAREQILKPVDDVPEGAMHPDEPLAIVSAGGQVTAYPVRLMRLRYPMVADKAGARNVLVVWHFAMQTASALEFERTAEGVPYRDAGVLYRGAHVIYDVDGRTLWDGYSGKALAGPRAGEQLARLDVRMGAWQEFRAAHADARLYLPPGSEELFRQQMPTPQILTQREVPFSMVGYRPWDESAHALPPMSFVLGVRASGVTRAYPLGRLYAAGRTSFTDTLPDGEVLNITVTSPRTALAEGPGVQQQVMLWYAWKDRNPDTTVNMPAGNARPDGTE
jgi:hypothetical protein